MSIGSLRRKLQRARSTDGPILKGSDRWIAAQRADMDADSGWKATIAERYAALHDAKATEARRCGQAHLADYHLGIAGKIRGGGHFEPEATELRLRYYAES